VNFSKPIDRRDTQSNTLSLNGTLALQNVILLLLLLICGVTDLLCKRIPNFATLPAILAGFTINTFLGDVGLRGSLIGFAFAFGLFYLFFLSGGMGGGDVKLAGAIGALRGWPFIFHAVLFSTVIGGVIAISVVIWKGELTQTLRNLWRVFYSIINPGLKIERLDQTESRSIPYGIAIILGTLWTMLAYHMDWI
jgi:prepilin peptidase CpaA